MVPPGTIRWVYSNPKKIYLALDMVFNIKKSYSKVKFVKFNYGPVVAMRKINRYHQMHKRCNNNVVHNDSYKPLVGV
jgi:hypothetical protein